MKAGLRSTLVEKTQKLIKQMIQDGEFDDRHFLPSEAELCQRFGVSRATVREAVRSMEVRGFVRREHGKGIRVIDNRVQAMTRVIADMISMNSGDLLELIEVRRIIEVEAAKLAAVRAEEKDLQVLENFLAGMEQASEMDDAYYDCDLNFHIALAQASKNTLLCSLITSCAPLMRDQVVVSSQADYVIESRFHFHRDILNFLRSRDPDGAAGIMRRHMERNHQNFLEQVKKTSDRLPERSA